MPDKNDLKPQSSLNGGVNPHIQRVASVHGDIKRLENKPVVQGKVTVRKKNFVERLDIPGMVTDAVIDKIIPDLRDIAFNGITTVLSTMIYGDDRAVSRRGYSSAARSTMRAYERDRHYRDYSSIRTLPIDDDRYAHPTSVYDPDDILFSNKEDVKTVYYKLENRINQYGQATVADLYDDANLSNINASDRFGWRDISDAHIRMVRDGYVLMLPRPINLDK